MKVNTKVRYGLRSMIEIAQHPDGILQKEIAERQEIPLYYLDTIITGLRNAGLIVNYAGKGSGYILAKNQQNISAYDVYRAFEPELQLVNCSFSTNECKRSNLCSAKDFWSDLSFEIKTAMENKMLDELVQAEMNLVSKGI
jgi:Rrf2 family transcriptional regulator, iron-sulfur cluster assembly transcription factor